MNCNSNVDLLNRLIVVKITDQKKKKNMLLYLTYKICFVFLISILASIYKIFC